MRKRQRQHGATLIELVVSIVIISISVTSVMMVVANATQRSADPMVRTQAISIATAYLEEILSQALTEPSGVDTGAAEAGEVRATYDDITDYHGLSDAAGAIDQFGNPIVGLEGYNVAVDVAASTVNGDPASRVRVTVTFDGDGAFAISLNAYRLN
ncbi:MAG: prepilin-type N-terminal cleavage/methylation domain-containing protein [Gammaproteobacteria bacterium]|nr:prepilin-type N-terminal cleavage/methylation domain-containing protein [Gammaproteobacteria bacterium]